MEKIHNNEEYVLLRDLSADHPARNVKLLKEINAEIRNLQSKIWRNVSTWKIGENTYNQLHDTWTEFSEFRCKKSFL